MKIKQGDNVLVIAGKDSGKQGMIEKVIIKEGRVIVSGVNITKRHLKPSRKNPHGGIISMPAPVNASNVMLMCPHCGKAIRVSHKTNAQTKERICRKCQGNLDVKVNIKEKKESKVANAKS